MSSEYSHKFENCVIASAWIKPESKVTDTPDMFKVENSAVPFEFMNGIYRTQLSPKALAHELPRQMAAFLDNNLRFRWYSFAHSEPDNLESILREKGPSEVMPLDGLYCRINDFDLTMPDGVTVEELDQKNLEEYAQTNTSGWESTGAVAESVKQEIRADFYRGNMKYRAFLARYKGEPAATGMFHIIDGDGYLLGGSTSPGFRGKGAYTGLVKHRLRLMKELKLLLCLISARHQTSSPICQKIGFHLGTQFNAFTFAK